MAADRYLLPGEVLQRDLIQPNTQAIFVPGGTVLTAEVIMKIRQAGLEDLALECVATRKQAMHAGIILRRFAPSSVLSATEIAQMRAERLVESATGMRAVLYLLLVASLGFTIMTGAQNFIIVTAAIFGALVLSYVGTAGIAEGFKKEIIDLKVMERDELQEKRAFLARVTHGDEDAIAEVVTDGLVGKDRLLSLEIERGFVGIHSLLADSVDLARRKGVELTNRPNLRDASHVQGHRLATTQEVTIILAYVHEVLTGIFAFSPSTKTVALSIFDPFEDPIGHTHFMSCIATLLVERFQFDEMTRGGESLASLGKQSGLEMTFERNGPFKEVVPVVYASEVELEPESSSF